MFCQDILNQGARRWDTCKQVESNSHHYHELALNIILFMFAHGTLVESILAMLCLPEVFLDRKQFCGIRCLSACLHRQMLHLYAWTHSIGLLQGPWVPFITPNALSKWSPILVSPPRLSIITHALPQIVLTV